LAGLNDEDSPEYIDIYLIPSEDVRDCFKAAYDARTKAGKTINDGNPMWICMDRYGDPDHFDYAGSGIINDHTRIARIPLEDVMPNEVGAAKKNNAKESNTTIASSNISGVLRLAREQIAGMAGVSFDAVNLECRIDTID